MHRSRSSGLSVCRDGARRPRGRHRASNGVATRRLLGAVRQRLRRQCLRSLPRLLRCLHGRHRPGAGGGPPCGKARPVGPASQNMPANWLRLAEAGGRPELDLALAGRAGGRIGRSLRLPCTQVVFLTLMVVWVAVRLARLATVAKNLHSQRRFSAMQVSRPAHTYPRVRGAPPGACLRGRAPPCKRRAPLSKEGPHPSCACVSRRRWTSTSPPRAPRTKETS